MRLLYILLLLCVAAILWACVGFARHVKKHRQRALEASTERTLQER